MNKNLSTIITNVANEVMDNSTSLRAIIKNYVNNRYFQILRAINWQNIRADYTLDTTAGTQEYVLPEDFGKEISVVDTTNGVELSKCDLAELLKLSPDGFSQEGSVSRYYIREDCVQAQPTSSSKIRIVSSSASDTTQIVLIRGISGGAEITEKVSLNGTSYVETNNYFTRVKGISKSASTYGKVTVTSNDNVVTLAVLSPEVLEARYKLIGFHYVPTQTLTIKIPYIIQPLPLNDDYDYPVLDIADLIETGAKADVYRYKRQFAKANVFETLFNTQLNDYIWQKENEPNKIYQFKPITYNKDSLV